MTRRIFTLGVTYLMAAISIMLLGSLLLGIRAYSKEKQDRLETENYYRVLEKDMVEQVRVYLESQGLNNSGVTLTHVTDEEEREYTLRIHHEWIDRMSREEKETLSRQLEKFFFTDDNCSLKIDFLIHN